MNTTAGRQMGFDYNLQNDDCSNPPITNLASYVGICTALGGEQDLSAQERHVSEPLRANVRDTDLLAVRQAILAGSDPLGSAYCALKSPSERRVQGQTFTPAAVVAAMIGLAEARTA